MKKKIIIISLVVLLVVALITGYVMHKISINPDKNTDIPVIKTEYIADDGVTFSFSPETNTLTVSGETVEDCAGYFDGKTELEYWFENTEKIVFAEGVTKSQCLFEDFFNVRTVELCSTMKYFSIGALPLFEKYVVAAGCKNYYNDENGVLYSIRYYEHNPEEKYITLDDIPNNAFITEFTIPDNVDELWSANMYNNKHIIKVIIGKDFDGKISRGIFNADNIEFFEAHPDNKRYCSDEQGILYNKNKTLIYAIPSTIEEIVMPENSRFAYTNEDGCNNKVKKITISNISGFFNYDNLETFKVLEEIVVPENNTEYCSVDGVAFSKDMSEILYFPHMKDTETYEIPSTVTEIDTNCFRETKKLRNLIIPDSVTKVGDLAFYYAEALETVKIGKGLKTFEIIDALNIHFEYENPFDTCDNLKFITVDKDNMYFCSDKQGALYTKDMKILMTVPAGRKSKKFTIPDAVETVRYSFTNCAELEVINIGRGLETLLVYFTVDAVDFYGFEHCAALKEINVSADNPNFESLDGVLYSKGREKLVMYPPSKRGDVFVIPEEVKDIEWKAFRLNKFIEKLYVGKNITSFENYYGSFLYFANDDNGFMMFDIYYEDEFRWPIELNEREKHTIYYNSVIPE